MNLVFDDLALADLEGIYNWIAKDNPRAAFAVVERLFESIEHLARFPHMVTPDVTSGRSNGSCRVCLTLSCIKSTANGAKLS